MKISKIEWTDTTWNPVRGCSRVSEGCRNCYAERQASRYAGPGMPFQGFASNGKWTGRVDLLPAKLGEPLHWVKPRRVFVNSMSDLFHESLSDEYIAAVFGVMVSCPQHTFQVLTKRPERMRRFFEIYADDPSMRNNWWINEACLKLPNGGVRGFRLRAPIDSEKFENVWLGVSVEDQKTADERIPILLDTPAAVRFVSAEPLLGPVSLRAFMWPVHGSWRAPYNSEAEAEAAGAIVAWHPQGLVLAGRPFVKWVIVGGESGPNARRCHADWIRAIVTQCARAKTACFVKQLGAHVIDVNGVAEFEGLNGVGEYHTSERAWPLGTDAKDLGESTTYGAEFEVVKKHPKGGDPSEWPLGLRVREFPIPPTMQETK